MGGPSKRTVVYKGPPFFRFHVSFPWRVHVPNTNAGSLVPKTEYRVFEPLRFGLQGSSAPVPVSSLCSFDVSSSVDALQDLCNSTCLGP